jgi:phenylpropionate dioxygenase-like ring-hydroxylating dioxygenase large terminal subunit
MPEPLPQPVPFGWFFVAYADELAPGDVRPLRYFGRDLVLFRSASGAAALLDAFCPHLGAHLGHGGKVDGESLRCPFHAWAWARDGRCADIPYASRIPPRLRESPGLHVYPLVERNQILWAWYHPANEKPPFEVIELPQLSDPDWAPLDRYVWRFRSNPQEIAENGVDPAHFRYVHRMDAVPEGETSYDGVVRRSLVEGPRTCVDPAGRERHFRARVETVQNGAGQKWTRLSGLAETLLFTLVTPIDAQEVELRFAFTHRRVPADSFEAKLVRESIASTVSGVEDDIRIWENKVHQSRPLLCDGDGPIPAFRRYFSQFYATAP